MEPPLKKMKTIPAESEAIDSYIKVMKESQKNLQPILSEEFTEPIPLTKVYVGYVKDVKNMSKIILNLNEKIPLNSLSHLKRVANKKSVLLCPVELLNGTSSIDEYLELNVPDLNDMFECIKEIEVPKHPAKVKSQCSHIWPSNFHPNKYYEKLDSGNFFNQEELERNKLYMEVVFESTKWYLNEVVAVLSNINVTVVVDPALNTVVAIACCTPGHPLKHSAMVAIDNVAKTQKGGVWDVEESELYNLKGVDGRLISYLNILTDVKFGAQTYVCKSGGETSKEGPYLCTGYYIYMLKEPCIMCSMALIHSRAKRIFFALPNKQLGAVNSKVKLQAVSSLNHHFEVFTGFL